MSGQTAHFLLPHLAFALQLSLGFVFLLSTLPKLRRPMEFAQSVVEYRILPAKIASIVALALIPLEAFLMVAFLTGWRTDAAFPIALVMLSIFTIAVGINIRRGRRIACGCFGSASEQISRRTLARLLVLLTVVLLLFAFRSRAGISVLNLAVLMAAGSTWIYLLQAVMLALFLILLAAWLLNLPELVFLVRTLGWTQVSADNTESQNELEAT